MVLAAQGPRQHCWRVRKDGRGRGLVKPHRASANSIRRGPDRSNKNCRACRRIGLHHAPARRAGQRSVRPGILELRRFSNRRGLHAGWNAYAANGAGRASGRLTPWKKPDPIPDTTTDDLNPKSGIEVESPRLRRARSGVAPGRSAHLLSTSSGGKEVCGTRFPACRRKRHARGVCRPAARRTTPATPVSRLAIPLGTVPSASRPAASGFRRAAATCPTGAAGAPQPVSAFGFNLGRVPPARPVPVAARSALRVCLPPRVLGASCRETRPMRTITTAALLGLPARPA